MQGICRLSRRWHQQFCHSPSFSAHTPCIQAFLPVRAYRQVARGVRRTRREAPTPLPRLDEFSGNDSLNPFSPSQLLSRDGDDLVVREFEQNGSDRSSRRQIQPGEELRDEAAEIWSELEDIDRQLEIAKQGPFGPQSEFMQQFPEEQRKEILEAFAKQGIMPEDEEDALDLAEIDRLMEEEAGEEQDTQVGELAVTLHISKAHQALVGQFNKSLRHAQANDGDVLKRLSLWKWYLRCRQKVPGFLQIVSENVWNFLWYSQSQLGPRKSHLVILGRDMIEAGQEKTDEQLLEYIQALNACGDIGRSLSTWEGTRDDLRPSISLEYLNNFFATGVQLYASVGRPQKAQNVAFGAIERGADPSLLLHVSAGWASSKTTNSSTKAWAIYLKMCTMLGDKMPAELYEKVSNAFLDNQRSQMALAVFKDMMSRLEGSGANTLQSYSQALGNIRTDANPEDVEQAVNQVSLTMLLTLPKRYQNKFFFASWIKKLLGQQRVNSASQVVDLMYERGIKPDAIHLNGIIGAWLRDKSPQARQKAETLALEMIQARINQVSQVMQNAAVRSFGNIYRKIVPVNESKNPWLQPIHLERPVPAANVETFSLLFDYNEQRHRWQEFSRLTEIMIGPAQLRPNNFIVNKWLASELRARSFSRFWSMFNGLKHDVTPDIETYGLAWQAIAAQQTTTGGKSTLSHRQLFADMMRWTQNLKPRQERAAKEDFQSGFYAQILRSFSYQLDVPGTLCALQGMHDAFSATPDDVSVQLVTGQVARILPRSDSSRATTSGRRRVNTKLSVDQTMLKGIAEIVSTLETKHKIDMVESGMASSEDVEDVESAASQKIRLDVMIELLTLVMQKTKHTTDNPAKTLRDVAKVMNVSVEHVLIDSILS